MSRTAEPLELYIHLPFCVKKCDYCDFLSGPADEKLQSSYMEALRKEIRARACEVPGRPVVSIFIGGGTPSLVKPFLIEKMFETINSRFAIAPDAEITIEANPGTLCKEKLKSYRDCGINRLSLGLQSPVDEELKLLGRIHSYRQFLESYSLAREAGFSNINVDLMSAIPKQTYEGWIQNLCTVAALGPEHISAYSLIVEEGTPFFGRPLCLPDEDTEYRMYEDTAGVLEKYGFRQYEISNYAREGFVCRHNIGYWRRRDYLGLGLGAASLMGKERFSNTRNMEEYLRSSAFLQKLSGERDMLSFEDERAEFMFLGLRMTEGISKKEFRQNFGTCIEESYGAVLQKYKKLSLLAEEGGRIFLTRAGIHVSNTIMAEFL